MSIRRVVVALAAALAFTMVPVAANEDFKITLMVDNQSTYNFNAFNLQLPWGKWGTAPQPIKAKTKAIAFMAQGARGSATGTSGSLEYRDGNGHSFKYTFDIPYTGSNSHTFSNCVGCDQDFVVTLMPQTLPPSGHAWTVTMTIKNK